MSSSLDCFIAAYCSLAKFDASSVFDVTRIEVEEAEMLRKTNLTDEKIRRVKVVTLY